MGIPAEGIRGIRYRNPDWPGLALEAVAMADFRTRAGASFWRRPRRPDFHHLLLCTGGAGFHEVDFQRLDLRPGVVVHVAPGQVHAFGWEAGLAGVVLMFAPEALAADAGVAGLPIRLALQGADARRLEAAFRDLLREYRGSDGTPAAARLLRHLLAALVLRLARAAPPEATASPGHGTLFQLFQREVEGRYRHTRSVAEYARRLGYAPRTLVRATREAAGVSAKAFIDARVLLEAKRLLAGTALGVGRIALHLGFSEASNFTKFFRRGAGMAPEAFRDGRGGGGVAAQGVGVTSTSSTTLSTTATP